VWVWRIKTPIQKHVGLKRGTAKTRTNRTRNDQNTDHTKMRNIQKANLKKRGTAKMQND